MFKCVFVPASSDSIQELSKSKAGGLENDHLRKTAEEHFSRTSIKVSSEEQAKQVNEMLIKQGIDPSTMDKNVLSQLSGLGGTPCEIVSLYLPTKNNNYESVSMYCDANGQLKGSPVNQRATSLANCCGHNITIFGDVYIGRCFDDDSQPWDRRDFTMNDMSSDAKWVINAKKKNQGKNMSSATTSGTMQNFMKQQQQGSTTTSSSSSVEEIKVPEKPEDIIKKEANAQFIAKNFVVADELYTKAIAIAQNDSLAVLYTNRSAARANLERYSEALEDAENAISNDPTWMKAYHRKSAALEKLNRHREAYLTWVEASKHCQADKGLLKQLQLARAQWIKVFRTTAAPIVSSEDLISRFVLLTDKRERLSTLAHLWNDASKEDRHQYFQVFLSLISDGNPGPAAEVFTVDFMVDMPMHNYQDLTRDLVAPWCDFMKAQSNEHRTAIFQQLWFKLSTEEQHDVIQDFKMLMSQCLHEQNKQAAEDSANNEEMSN